MSQTGATILVIFLGIGLTALMLTLKYFLRMGANKADDAIRNSITRSQLQKNPPKQQNLADRYR